ncbi:MAG: nucleoside-diphosphate kinase [Bacillota bacterium]
MEKSLVILKPEAVRRNLVGRLVDRLERAGLIVEELKMDQFDSKVIAKLYEEHKDKSFFDDIVSHMSENKIVAMVIKSEGDTIRKVRNLIGSTDPIEAEPGTIRGDYAYTMEPDNLIHASDSQEAAKKELKLFF